MSAECPTCNGTGRVPEHVATALNRPAARTSDGGRGACHCDGPPHAWSPTNWCPLSGPVTGGRR